ncbi:Syntaxin-22 [Triticum urartu]|uniref:Syntaxin-22 n=1 Tax=Triticum urartu TaxID=4572 RepID=M7YZJ4_TRIUA|nr:Syntaxin-22 [Triticum urartu]
MPVRCDRDRGVRQKTSHKVLQLAKDAKEKLTSAAEADKSTGTSADKRVADMKLAKDFAATMEEFRKLQNLAIQREMAYKPVVPQGAQPSCHPFYGGLLVDSTDGIPSAESSHTRWGLGKGISRQPYPLILQGVCYTMNDGRSDFDKMPEQRALLAEPNRLEVLQLDNEIVFNEAIIEERDQAIQDIQQQIGELTPSSLVTEEVDSNIENSAAATSEAKKEIGKASKTQKSNSSLLCLLMVIFGVVLLIVIIVLAS